MENRAHAKLAPSSAHQWMACPGSIQLIEEVTKTSGVAESTTYADEGSAAHELSELCLRTWSDARVHVGKVFDEYPDFPVTEDMADAVQVYLDYIRATVDKAEVDAGKVLFGIEERFDLNWVSEDIFGTGDCWTYCPRNRSLASVDYKHGSGVSVQAEWNPQVMLYALGALQTAWMKRREVGFAGTGVSASDMVDTIRIIIVQPRIFGEGAVREWQVSPDELLHWMIHVLRPCAQATRAEAPPRHPGVHCRFCDAKVHCSDHNDMLLETAQVVDFRDPRMPSYQSMSMEDKFKAIEAVKLIKAWVVGLEQERQREMEAGIKYEGLKLVRKVTRRKWEDPKAAERTLKAALKQKAYSKKLLSPAQAEKALKQADLFQLETFNQLIDHPLGDLVVAPADDTRRAVIPKALIAMAGSADALQ